MIRQAIKLNIIREGGAAQMAGLEPEDIIVRYGSTDILSPSDLSTALSSASGNVLIVFIRRGVARKATISAGPLNVTFGEVEVDIPSDDPVDISVPLTSIEIDREVDRMNCAALDSMIVSTAPSIDGYVVTKQLGVISAECVFGMNFFKDLFAAVSDIFGGRSATTQNALRQAREICISELKREALDRSANSIIAVNLDYSEFSGQGKSMLFLVATGTAVFIEKTNT